MNGKVIKEFEGYKFLTKKFGRIQADLEIEDGVSHCYLTMGPQCSATLECLDAVGYFEQDDCKDIPVAPQVIADIRKWAEANGY